jgi:hypothetical protein
MELVPFKIPALYKNNHPLIFLVAIEFVGITVFPKFGLKIVGSVALGRPAPIAAACDVGFPYVYTSTFEKLPPNEKLDLEDGMKSTLDIT